MLKQCVDALGIFDIKHKMVEDAQPFQRIYVCYDLMVALTVRLLLAVEVGTRYAL